MGRGRWTRDGVTKVYLLMVAALTIGALKSPGHDFNG